MWWSVHHQGGPRRVNHAACSVDDKIFSFGGYCTGENYRDPQPIDVFVLNTSTYRWKEILKSNLSKEEVKSWPYQRFGHTVCHYQDKIFLFGGRNDERPCNTIYCFDTKTFKWSQPKVSGDIAARDGHSACIINDAMYVFGGYEENWYHFNHDVFKLNLTTMTWTCLPCNGNLPLARDFHSATAIGDLMFIFGGRSDNSQGFIGTHLSEYYNDKLTYLDTTTLTWFTPKVDMKKPHPSGRRSHSAINFDGKLLLFGGFNGSTDEHKNDMWILDPSTWVWQQIFPHGEGPNPRRRQALCQVGNQLFLFGGTSPYNGPKLFYTEEQLAHMPDDHQTNANLMDHNDLWVLELSPSLRTLCLINVIKNRSRLDISRLPLDVLKDIDYMTKDNSISKPLVTLKLG